MARSKTDRVTPNVQKCLDELRSAVKTMPPGEAKKRAKAALNLLDTAFSGKPQPRRLQECPKGTAILHT
jgi:hypothetical protein